jgi:nucleotide-binding universal stress UspA family protein
MFKHLLLPTDGSLQSEEAIRQGIALAKETQARVTGIHVVPEFHVFTYRPDMLEDTRAEYLRDSQAKAAKILESVENAAREAGVPCDTVCAVSDEPYEAIIKTADEKGCDLIAMASHGHKGIKGLLVGSETQKVLTHSHQPVIVLR